MHRVLRRISALLLTMLVVGGCAPSQSGSSGAHTTALAPAAAAPKRLLAGIMGNPPTFSVRINHAGAGNIPGGAEVESLLNSGLTIKDDRGAQAPLLTETVPSTENGHWSVTPDGRMETTWKLRRNAVWHDGEPFTAEDLMFTAMVDQDRELPIARDKAYNAIESVEAPDPYTLVVKWDQIYIYADMIFTAPLPKHLLEKPYMEDKASFTQLPAWNRNFVGTGPFKLQEWAEGSHVVLAANDAFVLGRPKLDEIEVRFVPDQSTLIANILAGVVEVTFGRGFSIEQAMALSEQWTSGRMHPGPGNTWITMYPQLLTPSPGVVADLQFRRGLLHAIDRQAMADSLQAGLFPVAHSYTGLNEPEHEAVQSRVVKYEYDARKAIELIDGLGYTRSSDSSFRDSSGQRLSVELRGNDVDISQKSVFSIADYWQRIGVGVEPVIMPPQRARDREYRATFPAFQAIIQSNSLPSLGRFHTRHIPLRETSFAGDNYPRYSTPEFDLLLDRYFVTVQRDGRLKVLGDIEQHMTDRLPLMPLFYSSNPYMIGNRLRNMGESRLAAFNWNVPLWDVN